ncbi:MAG: CBS domain-containing protein [Blastocatellia bacterium]
MSRSKTGMDREQRNENTEAASEPRTANTDQRFANDRYTMGRESRRDFPRRSSSMRGRDRADFARSEDDRLNIDDSRNANRYDRNRGRDTINNLSPDYRDVSGGRQGASRVNQGYGQEYGRYGNRDEERHGSRNAYREEDYGRHSYNDLASGRSDHEDFQRSGGGRFRGYGRDNFPGYRRHELSSDYDVHEDEYRRERRDYDEPYNRQTTGGRYEAETDYPYSSPDRAFSGPTGWTGGGYESGRDYRRDDRRDERNWGRGRSELRCSEIMTKNVTTCGPDSVIRDVADLMEDDNVGSIPVVENGRLIGIVTDRDIVCRIIAEGSDTRTVKAREVMSEDIVTCTPDDSVMEAIRKMGEHQIRRIPVCDPNGRLRGIISLGDIALEAERDQDLANALEQISQPTPQQARRV